MVLVTSRKVGGFENVWGGLKCKFIITDEINYETSIIHITKVSKEIPERIRKWLNNRTHTFFDRSKRKIDPKDKKNNKKSKQDDDEIVID
jgi:hypothetical protein